MNLHPSTVAKYLHTNACMDTHTKWHAIQLRMIKPHFYKYCTTQGLIADTPIASLHNSQSGNAQ